MSFILTTDLLGCFICIQNFSDASYLNFYMQFCFIFFPPVYNFYKGQDITIIMLCDLVILVAFHWYSFHGCSKWVL